MKPVEKIFAAARGAQRHIVLPEGDDPRIQEAAAQAVQSGLARITLLGDPAAIPSREGVEILDPARAPELEQMAAAYFELRKAKGMTEEQARRDMTDPLAHAAMRVRLGLADGTVGGAVATTADTVRAALRIIGTAPGNKTVSSFFLMLGCAPEEQAAPFSGGMIFSDCGLIVTPTAQELAAIAIAAAGSCRSLLGEEPQVAMLSFSTAGSAKHESVDRIQEALALVRAQEPELKIDGEMQFDAAFDAAIRARKAPDSPLVGRPNVMIFPDLGAGNIGYKIAQRLGGLQAIGPILQGLRLPANDLSRGCSVEDILSAIAITAVQGGAEEGRG